MNNKNKVIVIGMSQQQKPKTEPTTIVVTGGKQSLAFTPTNDEEGSLLYREIGKYINIYAKSKERDNVTNKLLATAKKIKRQIDAEHAANDEPRILKLLGLSKDAAEHNFFLFDDQGFHEVAKEEEAFASLVAKLMGVIKR